MAELVKKSLRDWNAQFGKAYPKLSIAVQCYVKPDSNTIAYPSTSTTITTVVPPNTTSQMVLRVWQDQINAVVEGLLIFVRVRTLFYSQVHVRVAQRYKME